MRSTSLSESVDIISESIRIGVDTLFTHGGFQLIGIVDSLSTRHDFLSSHEEIVRIRQIGVGRVAFGVEGSHRVWEFIENIKVGVVFGPDQYSQFLLLGSGEISDEVVLFCRVDSCVFQNLDPLEIPESKSLAVLDSEITGSWEELLDHINLSLVS